MKRNLFLILLALGVSACGTIEVFNHESPPEYLTIGDAEFFGRGPAQLDPPQKIAPDTRVVVLKKDSGFAQVELPDGRKGYMIWSELKEAPPEPVDVPFDPIIVEELFIELPPPDLEAIPDEVPHLLMSEE
jgi:hypothetical protein